jgi:hypothetical protein
MAMKHDRATEQAQPTSLDLTLAEKRRCIALALMLSGKLDPESGMNLYDSAFSDREIREERAALDQYEKDPKHFETEQSPLGRRYTLLAKLAPYKAG